jgi:hypothetical protein
MKKTINIGRALGHSHEEIIVEATFSDLDLEVSSVPPGEESPIDNPIEQNPDFIVSPDGDYITDPSGNQIVTTPPGLTNRRLLVDSSTVHWDFMNPGQAQGNING